MPPPAAACPPPHAAARRLRSSSAGIASGGVPLARPLPVARRARAAGVCARTRDGKQRRKPADRSADAAPAAPPAPPPRRVDPNVNVDVRRQILWGRINRQYEREAAGQVRPAGPVRHTASWRKESVDPEEHRRRREQQEALAAAAARQRSDTLTLRSMFNTAASAPGERPLGVTLVDGYNLLFRMRRHDAEVAALLAAAEVAPGGGDLEAARELLLRRLDVYSAQEGMFVHVVLDAMGSGFSSQHNRWGMIVTFSGKAEADTVIMERAQAYIDMGVPKVCIVSDDAEVAELGAGGASPRQPGAQAVCASSCAALVKLMEQSRRKLEGQLSMLALKRGARASLAAAAKPPAGAGSGGLAALRALRQDLAQQEAAAVAQQRRQRRQQQRQQQPPAPG